MGLLCSCCRRRKSPEEKPLLIRPQSEREPPYPIFEKLADIVGAINSRKLPSQDQISALLQHALRTEFLLDAGSTVSGLGGPLSQQGATVIFQVRELVDALLRIGLEKNYDDKLQELLHLLSQDMDVLSATPEILVDGSPVGIDPQTSREISQDTNNFLRSLKSLVKLALSSSAFRMFISDILGTTREIIAEAASEFADVAAQIQVTAIQVAKTAELDDIAVDAVRERAAESYSGLHESVGNVQENLGTLGDESAERLRTVVVGRVQELIVRAHQNPQHKAAIYTILTLLRKYSERITDLVDSTNDPVTIEAQIDMSTPLHNALVDFKVLLERLGSGRSLDPMLRAFKAAIADILDAPKERRTEINRYFTDLHRWMQRALAEPQFAASQLGTRTAEELYTAGHLLLASEANTRWARDVRALVTEAQSFIHALESDMTTQRLIKSLHTVSAAIRGLFQDALVPGARARRDELLRDALAWLIPRILKSVRAFPMPRVEYKSSTLDVALDALLLTGASSSASLSPDHLWVQNWNEVRVDMAAGANASPSTSSRTRIHTDGIRCAAHGLGYYLNYRDFIQYSDEGVLDVDVGHPDVVGEGLAVDVEFETTQRERDTPGEPLFRLVNATVSVPGLAFTIKHSKHWILNALIQPLAGPTVRLFLTRMLEQQISKGFAWADRLLSATVEEAERTSGSEAHPTLEEYWAALLATAPAFFEKRGPASAPAAESHTEPTLKGIIHTTTTLPEDQTPEETVLAVGAGAQLFPNKGGPYGSEEDTAGELAREAVVEVQQVVEHGAGKAKEVVETAANESVRIRDEIERSEVRKADREIFESHRGGWRSNAFDMDLNSD